MTTPHHWVEYAQDWRHEPMAYWVHMEPAGQAWKDATHYEPPAPARVHGKGYPVLCIEVGDTTLRFSSQPQLSEFLRTMALTPLPTSLRLSRLRAGAAGPNAHWLSRLPAKLKSPKGRRAALAAVEHVVKVLKSGMSSRAVA